MSPNGKTRYVAIPDGARTVVAQILVRNGAVLRSLTLNGRYGVAYVTNDGTVGGLSFNGRVLVLSAYSGSTVQRRTSRFAVVDIKRWQPGKTLRLRGDLTFDALSPGGRMLYLIEHTSRQDYNRYRVRAYDLAYGRMLHRTIVDRREPSDVMVGSPTARATSPGGGWVYTLYQRSNGSSFVHALDTRRAEAVCIDLPRKATKSWRYGASLLVSRDGTQLRIRPFPNAAARRRRGHADVRGEGLDAGLGGRGDGRGLGRVRDRLDDLDDVAVRVEDAQLAVGARAAGEDVAHALELALAAELARVRLDVAQRAADELRDRHAVAAAGRRGPSPAPRARSAPPATCSRSSGCGGTRGSPRPARSARSSA